MRYYSWYFLDLVDPSSGHAFVYNHFVDAWHQYITDKGGNLLRAYQAMLASYDPLHNYDMTEQAADGTRKSMDTQTTTPHGKITQTSEQSGTLTDTTTQFASGLDSTGDGVQTGKTTTTRTPTTYKTTNETTYGSGTDSVQTTSRANDQTASADGHTITGADVASEHYLTRSGNIGVTTSQQMLQSEITLRMTDSMLEDFVIRFIGKYCICTGVFA